MLRHSALALALLLAALLTGARGDSFEPLFNGRDLQGWDGDPAFWSVQNGMMRGEITLAHLAFRNTFLIWRGGVLKDFALKLRFRLLSGNSGVQYRSQDLGGWSVSGYQAEIANEPGKAGFLYEERSRKFLVFLGQRVLVRENGSRDVFGSLGTKAEFLRWGYYRPGDWNDYLIVARGPWIAHYLNGFQTLELIDRETMRASPEGILAFQIHAGLPMAVEFKDVFLKRF
jgi:hypothetical protein